MQIYWINIVCLISVWGNSHWIFCQKCIFPLWISVCLHVLQVKLWVFFAYYRHLCIYFNFLSNFLIFSYAFLDFSVKSAFFSLGIRVQTWMYLKCHLVYSIASWLCNRTFQIHFKWNCINFRFDNKGARKCMYNKNIVFLIRNFHNISYTNIDIL